MGNDSGKRHNVLLLCMSTVSPTNPMRTTYLCDVKRDEKDSITDYEEITGYMTNEAPAKSVVHDLHKRGEKLDKIVMICTDKVGSKIHMNPGDNAAKPGFLENDGKLMDLIRGIHADEPFPDVPEREQHDLPCTHIEYFKTVLNAYAQEETGCGIPEEIYREIRVGNVMDSAEISRAVIEAANEITASGEETGLFIDYNGGMRDVAFMLLSVSNLMKLRGVEIRQILTMNFDNKIAHPAPGRKEKVVEIKVRNPVFESVDLITAINEYVRYGRIRGLKDYFATERQKEAGTGISEGGRVSPSDAELQRIGEILNEMEEFSHNLQLCRTDYVLTRKDVLYEKLLAYMESVKSGSEEGSGVREQLFGYVVDDILRGYHGLLDGDLPDIIEWCVDHDYIQQAVTFCSEQLPGYFWENEIIAPTRKEKEFYWKCRKVDPEQVRAEGDKSPKDQHKDPSGSGTEESSAGDAGKSSKGNKDKTGQFFNKIRTDLKAEIPDQFDTYDAGYAVYAYEWMIKFLYYGKKQNLREGMNYLGIDGQYGAGVRDDKATGVREDLLKSMSRLSYPGTMVLQKSETEEGDASRFLYFDQGPDERHPTENRNKIRVTWRKDVPQDELGQINLAVQHATKWIMLYEDGDRIIKRTEEGAFQRMIDISIMYYLLKDQRNETNHAGKTQTGWSYEELCIALRHMVALLRSEANARTMP